MIFRNDIRDVFLVLYSILSLVLPFAISFADPLIWFITAPIVVFINLITMGTSLHYHIHNNIFKSKKLNRIYEILTSAAISVPVQGYAWYHTMHHKYNNDKPVDGKVNDPSSTYVYNNIWKYTFIGAIHDISGKSIKDLHNYCNTPIRIKDFDKLKTENRFIFGKFILLFLLNWMYGLLYVVIYYFTVVANRAEAWGEHNEVLDHKNFRANSVSNYSKIYNILTLNSGYHQEHHVRPAEHWTKLPKITKTLPKDRTTTKRVYIFNGPWYNDLIKLFKA